jgi:hypothetical protein
MAKGKVARAETKDQVPAKTDGRSISAPEPAEYHRLAATHCVLTAPYQYVKDDQVRGPSVDGSVELYMGLPPKNALESILGSLIVNVSNTTHDCLSQAARVPPTEIQHRDVNLRHALKGATVVTQLVDALERLRGNHPANVSVGNVKVESGGQAIVGTVQSDRRDQESHPNTAGDGAKAPPKNSG